MLKEPQLELAPEEFKSVYNNPYLKYMQNGKHISSNLIPTPTK